MTAIHAWVRLSRQLRRPTSTETNGRGKCALTHTHEEAIRMDCHRRARPVTSPDPLDAIQTHVQDTRRSDDREKTGIHTTGATTQLDQ
ncbi:hypothetical protein T265_03884 [Opisthorchis viverrini]|uniref:Uncharacterized protein n=1 Tax=Opisthorchis viverrini TaxID=6198 RepID=A0A075AH98_OPIVI|nr:hypothetical protein T265_03884 [Opisthorchis viverrini]KER29509.1 hypothetical protein T265_03884 [Opisthorchis viverrini]